MARDHTPTHSASPSGQSTQDRVAWLVSVLIQPISIGAAIAVVVPLMFQPSSALRAVTILAGLVLLGGAPLVPIVRGMKNGQNDLMVTEQTIRGPIFIAALTGYLAAVGVFILLGAAVMAMIATGFAVITGLIWVVNHWSKISVHMASIVGAMTFILLGLGFQEAPAAELGIAAVSTGSAAALVAWARFRLRAHTPGQLAAGALVAALATALMFWLFWPYTAIAGP